MQNTNSNVISLNSFFQDPRLDELGFYDKPSSLLDADDQLFDCLAGPWEPLPLDNNNFDRSPYDFIEIDRSAIDIPVINIPEERQIPDPKPKKSKKLKKRKRVVQKNRYYDKNVCRNILRRAIRCIDSGMYELEVSLICANSGCSVELFRNELVASMELLIGPSALRGFLDSNLRIAAAVKDYLRWFLRERYIREALSEGQMKDIKRYVEYKNRVLLLLVQ